MDTVKSDTKKKVDYWDQTETSSDFNLGITGKKTRRNRLV